MGEGDLVDIISHPRRADYSFDILSAEININVTNIGKVASDESVLLVARPPPSPGTALGKLMGFGEKKDIAVSLLFYSTSWGSQIAFT